jgi:hypothetical protein
MFAHFFIDDHGRRATRGVRIVRVVILNILFLGLLCLGIYETVKCVRRSRWTPAGCDVSTSTVTRLTRSDDSPYCTEIVYHYAIGGKRVRGGTGPDGFRFSDAAEAYRLARRFPVGSRAVCFVNPDDTSESLLQREDPRLAMWFTAGSALVLIIFWFTYCASQLRETNWIVSPPEKKRRTEFIAAFAIALGGIAAAIPFFILPLLRNADAMRWPAVPCTVISRNVLCHEVHGEGYVSLYSPDVLYRYVVDGTEYHSNQYGFANWAMPYYSGGKRAIAGSIASGPGAVCYVNPRDPSEAVLTRAISPTLLFIVIPSAFVALGVWGMIKHRPGSATGYESYASTIRRMRRR